MTKTEFELLLDEIFNEFDCKIENLEYSDDGICKVNYFDGFFNKKLFVAYRFMNRARLRLKIMDELDLLTPVNPEDLDLRF